MEKLLYKIKNIIDKDLNEYVKWVILLALYLFYRMMATTFEDKQLSFLIIPIIFAGICVLIAEWIIDDLISYVQLFKKKFEGNQKAKRSAFIVGVLFSLSFFLLISFYFIERFSLLNAGFLAILTAGIYSRFQRLPVLNLKQKLLYWASYLVILTGLAGLIHALIFENNAINSITFIFYVQFFIYYFVSNSILKKAVVSAR